jgi:glutamine---fructose-6-phosphate transaminase (isomerizing)
VSACIPVLPQALINTDKERRVTVDLKPVEGNYLRDLLDQPRALEDTVSALDISRPLLDLTRQLQTGKFQRIVLTGMGASFHALHPTNLQLTAQGFTAIMVETSELVHYQTRLFDPGTLIVAVSQSGQSAEMVRMAEVNRQRAPVIAVTNTPHSSVAKHAMAALFTRAGSEFSVSCKTYVSTLIALKWLSDIFCQQDTTRIQSELSSAAPAVAAYLANWRSYVVELAKVLAPVRHLFLVGRGASLAAVGAGALIIKESDHFHAEGMSSAAFRHGPFEMLNDETFVVVFSGDDKTRDLNLRLLADIQKAGGKAGLVGEDSAIECFRLKGPDSSIRAILEVLPIQMATLALAALAGREPGKFDLATKVTATE